MAFDIEFGEKAVGELEEVKAFLKAKILKEIEKQLAHSPVGGPPQENRSTNQGYSPMKRVSVEQLSRETPAFLDIAQKERVIVTRNGKPLAMLLGIENKDEEDYALERDEAFWMLIHERRKESKMIPIAEVRKRLRLTPSKTQKALQERPSKKWRARNEAAVQHDNPMVGRRRSIHRDSTRVWALCKYSR